MDKLWFGFMNNINVDKNQDFYIELFLMAIDWVGCSCVCVGKEMRNI